MNENESIAYKGYGGRRHLRALLECYDTIGHEHYTVYSSHIYFIPNGNLLNKNIGCMCSCMHVCLTKYR